MVAQYPAGDTAGSTDLPSDEASNARFVGMPCDDADALIASPCAEAPAFLYTGAGQCEMAEMALPRT